MIDYKSGQRKFEVDTPVRRHTLKQVYRKEFGSAINNLQNRLSPEEVMKTPAKIMMDKIKGMCCLSHNSIFRNTDEAICHFTWDSVWQELAVNTPNMLCLFKLLFRGAPKSFICYVISMIIKWRSPKMGLIQGVISTLMYGNAANKQVSM